MLSEKGIRKARQERGLSQAKLAKLLGIDQARLSQWELGKAKPGQDVLKRLEEILSTIDDAEVARLRKRRIVRYDRQSSLPTTAQRHRTPHIPERGLGEIGSRGKSSATGAERPSPPAMNYSAIALFAGCGGMSLGFQWAGYQTVGYVEVNSAFRSMYQVDFPDATCLGSDIREISNEDVLRWKDRFGPIDALFGGPPCQGFSLAGKRDRFDTRNQLYMEFARIASVLQPAVVVMENVRVLTSMKTPHGRKTPERILQAFSDAGYLFAYQSLNAQDYGVPQSRDRVFFVGARKELGDLPITFPPRTHGPRSQLTLFDCSLKPHVTFRDATGDLESLESGQRSSRDPLHFAVDHPPHVIEWLKNVPEGKSAHDNPDPRLRPPSGYNTTYKRIRWDEPCSTIGTTFGMISGSRNVHPSDTRSLTIREAMRCQSFPDDFKVFGRLGDIRSAIGNAVPPLMAKVIAEHVRDTILVRALPPRSRLDAR